VPVAGSGCQALEAKVLVFVETKQGCVRLTRRLNKLLMQDRSLGREERERQQAFPIHGGMPQEEREYVLDRLRSGWASVVVATDVAARGIDIPDLTHVINYDLPSRGPANSQRQQIEDYVHRVGRTGRAGRSGVAHSFFTTHDAPTIGRALVRVLVAAGQEVPGPLEHCLALVATSL
jgi:superfamily II DNA/RNA helicase